MLKVLARAIRRERQKGKGKVKLSLFIDNMTLYLKGTKNSVEDSLV
jgi:hypothetical protein